MRENRLKWIEHILRREKTEALRLVEGMNVERKRKTIKELWECNRE